MLSALLAVCSYLLDKPTCSRVAISFSETEQTCLLRSNEFCDDVTLKNELFPCFLQPIVSTVESIRYCDQVNFKHLNFVDCETVLN